MTKALLVLSIILVFGCLSSTTVQDVVISPDGLRITSFSVDKNPVQSGEEIGFLTRMQNVGEMPAGEVRLCIKRSGGFAFKEDVSCPGPSLGGLDAPDARVGMPGQVRESYWTATVPGTPFPKDQPITAQASYSYETVATRETPILSKARMDELQESTAELRKGAQTLTKSPLRLEIQAQDPIQVDQTGVVDFSFDVVLSNVGKGYIQSGFAEGELPGWCTENLNCIEQLEVEILGVDTAVSSTGLPPNHIKCERADGWSSLTNDGTDGYRSLRGISLWQGKEARVKCKAHIELAAASEKYPVLRATAAYTYHIENTLTMEVLP